MISFRAICFKILAFFPIVCAADQWPVAPSDISTPGVNASDPHIAIDPNGNVVAVWLENGFVMARAKPFGDIWSFTIDSLSNVGASDPQIVLDYSGNATAVWVENGAINTATKPFNSSWSGSTALSSAASSSSPQIAVSSNGDVVAVWTAGGLIQSATRLFNQSWQATPDTLSDTGADFPQIAIGADGTVVAIWHVLNENYPINTIFSASKLIDGAWSTAITVSDSTINSVFPEVAVDNNGNASAIWFKYNVFGSGSGSGYSNVILQSSSLSSGSQAWTSPVDISAPGIRNPADLIAHIDVDTSGNAIAVWTTSFDGTLFNYEWSKRQNGAWSQPRGILSQYLTVNGLDVSIDFGSKAYLIWIYQDPISSSLTIQGSVNDLTNAMNGLYNVWTLSAGGNNAYPCGRANKSGSVHHGTGAWVNYNGANNCIQALVATFPVVDSPSNPSVIQNTTDFGVLTERYNVFSWQPSFSDKVVAYRIFRDGLFLDSVTPDVLQYVDRNRNEHETVTYSVEAFDLYGFISNPVEVVFSN